MIIGVVLGVDSRLGYWDLVGGGEIRNMVSIVFFSTVSNSHIYEGRQNHITETINHYIHSVCWFQALGSSGQVTALDLSPDGRFLAIGTETSVVKVFDLWTFLVCVHLCFKCWSSCWGAQLTTCLLRFFTTVKAPLPELVAPTVEGLFWICGDYLI